MAKNYGKRKGKESTIEIFNKIQIPYFKGDNPIVHLMTTSERPWAGGLGGSYIYRVVTMDTAQSWW